MKKLHYVEKLTLMNLILKTFSILFILLKMEIKQHIVSRLKIFAGYSGYTIPFKLNH
jgi:hypothetical protein